MSESGHRLLVGVRTPRRRWTPGVSGWVIAMIALVVLVAAIALIFFSSRAHGATAKPGEADVFWKSSDYARLAPASIAQLPAVTYDRSADNERLVSEMWAASFSKGSYRWLSATSTKALLSGDPGEPLAKRARDEVLKDGRVDSLLATALCGRMRVQAVLSVFVDQWDKQAIEPDQSGKPWARVHVHAAMVDSLGRLLWTGAGTETVEGQDVQPVTPTGSRSEALPTPSEFATGQGQPPPFREVLTRLFTRWSAVFPQRTAAK